MFIPKKRVKMRKYTPNVEQRLTPLDTRVSTRYCQGVYRALSGLRAGHLLGTNRGTNRAPMGRH